MLTFNLKKEWFDKIKSGEKTHEYREVKDYWTDRFITEFFAIDKKKEPKHFELKKYEWLEYLKKNMDVCFFHKIQFMNGMFPAEVKPRLFAYTKFIRIVDGKNTDLKIDKPVYDIEFELIKEQTNEK